MPEQTFSPDLSRAFLSIDLKSYYASVELTARHLDPLTTNLVVADVSRTEKTICLAVSPSLKAYGIPGRARLFEVIQRLKEVNAQRFREALQKGLLPRGADGAYHFSGSSADAAALAADPSLEVTYLAAPPRMKLYEKISTRIFSIYARHISPEDIHVYSIDECFLDVTRYLKASGKTAHELAIGMIREVLEETGITATCGIGTNLYLAKVAMDIVAKHVPPDRDGVRIAELDELSYREKLWCHTPLTDFWRVGRGITRRLNALGLYTMGDIARQSLKNEEVLYDALGVNAELLIDHAWGWEPTEIAAIRSYVPETTSISSGQVLMEPYDTKKARIILREMTEALAMDLVRKGLVTKQVVLTLGYDRSCIEYRYKGPTLSASSFRLTGSGRPYSGAVTLDFYGRPVPKSAHGTGNIDRWTSSTRRITETMLALFDRIVDPSLTVRRVTVVAAGLIPEKDIPSEAPVQLDLFTDYADLEQKRKRDAAEDEKERRLQKATLVLQEKFGKNAVLKALSLEEGATARLRNAQIGGHRAGEEEDS